MYSWPCPTPSQASCLLDLLKSSSCLYCQQDDRASNSPVSSSAPTDAADGSRGGALEAHQKQRKSSLGTNQNIIPLVPLVPKCLFNDLLWTGAKFSPFDLLSLALNPMSEVGIDPDLNRSWMAATLSCKTFLSHYSSAETERKTRQPAMLPQSRWHRLALLGSPVPVSEASL